MYDPATDFAGLWRNSGGNVSKLEMPGLDFVVAALARAGIITLSVSATAPVANQSTTAWLQAAVPSYSAEGALQLWDKITTAYLPATPGLFFQFLEATAGASGVSWWTSVGGAPLNTVGLDGDFAARTDTPNGIYGPKAAGAWPADPIPGTADVVTSAALDNTFGAAQGDLIVRGAAVWQALPIGATSTFLVADGGINPAWAQLTNMLDALFANAQGSILHRNADEWVALAPGDPGEVLSSGGPGANPEWAPRTAEFNSGTVMIFRQDAAPVGWTKDTSLNDYGLRVVSGAVGATPGTAFSTVFAQTTVGNHALTSAEMPAHNHDFLGPGADTTTGGGGFAAGGSRGATFTGSIGGGAAHNHTVNLTLAYADVIIAAKD